MPRAFDARHLSSTKDTQLQMTNWYEIVIPGFDDFTLMVRDCTLPEISTPPVEIGYGNSRVKLPGQAQYADGSITFNDAIKMDMEKKLLEWQAKVYDPVTGKMGWVDEFKKDTIVTQYGPDGTFERTWHFEGAWPSSISYGQMSGDNSDAKQMSVTLSYDRAYRE